MNDGLHTHRDRVVVASDAPQAGVRTASTYVPPPRMGAVWIAIGAALVVWLLALVFYGEGYDGVPSDRSVATSGEGPGTLLPSEAADG